MDFREFLSVKASPTLHSAISTAIRQAESYGQGVQLPHLLGALLNDSSVVTRLSSETRVRCQGFLGQQIRRIAMSPPLSGRIAFDVNAIIPASIRYAEQVGATTVTPLLFLTTCLTPDILNDAISIETLELMKSAGLSSEYLLQVVMRDGSAPRRNNFVFQGLGFGEDLTAKAATWQLSPLVGMEEPLLSLTKAISGGSESIALIGEPGVGKSSLVYGLAYHIAHKTRPLIPPDLDNWSVVSISQLEIFASTSARGDLEARVSTMLDFLSRHKNVLAFFDEIHTLLDSEDISSRVIATAMKPRMANGEFRCIGATTDKEYSRFIAKDQPLDSRFTKVLIPEPDKETTIRIASGIAGALIPDKGKALSMKLAPAAIERAVYVTSRYRRSDQQPRKTIRLLKRVAADVLYTLETTPQKRSSTIDASDVSRAFSDMSGIPIAHLQNDVKDLYEDLEIKLNGLVQGQQEAISKVLSWLAMHDSGWVNPQRPRGRYLFLGPPGVGKSELALKLAEHFMYDRNSIVVKNMGEFKNEGARSRFMGADPGYVGYGETSTIYSKVAMRPYSVVVLDEIEKAHHELADVLISVLDGAAEDAQGRWVDFSQCIFVMTSNSIVDEPNDRNEDTLRRLLLAQDSIWTPPLLDRVDRVILFRPLERQVLLQILNSLISDRRAHANRAFPSQIDLPETRSKIVDDCLKEEGTSSARNLERGLLSWLTLNFRPSTSPD